MTQPTQKPPIAKPLKRRPYATPVVREEEVFERLALQGTSEPSTCTGETGICGTAGTAGTPADF